MGELKTNRRYQERFLDGFDRSQLRQEVQKTKPRLSGLRKKYATWALGASLALGGIGVPMKMVQQAQDTGGKGGRSIAAQVATGAAQVATGMVAAVEGVESVASAPLEAVTAAPVKLALVAETAVKLALVTETAKEQFFKSEIPFGSIIYSEAKKHDIRPELVAAVVQAESRFKPTARSGVGAVGLMQLMPKTGKWMGARDLTNPAQNIAAGSKYLRYLHDRFDGNETNVLAAYNAGEGNVRRFGGIPPFKETRSYVSKVRTYEKEFAERVEGNFASLTTTPDVLAR